jgi:hypothetical protein
VAFSALHAGRLELVVAAVGLLGMLLLVVALAVRLPAVVAWAVALLGAAYASALLLRAGTIDGLAPVVAVGLLLTAELSYWSMEPHLPSDRGIGRRRAQRLALIALVGGGVSALVLAASEAAGRGGLGLEALGVAAAAGALAVVAWLARAAARGGGTNAR